MADEKKTTEAVAPVVPEVALGADPSVAVAGEAIPVVTPKRKRKTIRQVAHGRAYIQATFNNTIVTLTDLNGNVLASSSAGQNGFKGPKKSTPFAAGIIVKNASLKAKPYGLKDVNVFVKGIGSGRDAAVRALNANGLNIVSIKDVTPIPHNGVRKRGPRRV